MLTSPACRCGRLSSALAVMIAIASSGALACSIRTDRPYTTGPRQETEPRRLLLRELRERAQSGSWRVDSAAVMFVEIPSSIPGVVYHWGMFHPPRAVHVNITAVVAARNGAAAPIRTAADWFRATGGYHPSSADQALAACIEAVHTTSEPRAPRGAPRVYTAPDALDALPLSDSTRSDLSRRLQAATVENIAGRSWVARMWLIERSMIRKYECRIEPERLALVPVDSVPGALQP
jgi:hypothetical protein